MYSDIFDSIKTKHQLDLLLEEIEVLKNSIYETKAETFEDVLSKEVRDYIADFMRRDLKRDSEITKQEYIAGLEKALAKIKIIKLTTAIEPTDHFVETLSDWVAKNIGAGIVIDFKVNTQVVGGAMISYGGKYHDFTLAKTLDALFQQKSEEIIATLTKAS